MSNKDQLLHDIDIVSFVLDDLSLFLDTHPTDAKAIEYYNHYNRLRQQMVREFSMKYYPLTLDYADSNKEWRWSCTPLPWEPTQGGCK